MKTCEYCGKVLEDNEQCNCEGAQKARQSQQTLAETKEKINATLNSEVTVGTKKVNVKAIIVVVAIALVLLFGINFIQNRPSTVKWDKYVTVNFSGIDSRGSAELVIDWDGLCDSVKSSRRYALEYGSSIELNKDEYLSNGEEVTVSFKYDPTSFENNKLKVKNNSVTFTVEGLEQATPVDAFADISVSFEGVNGFGTAVITNNSTDPFVRQMIFQVPENQNLSNGSTITVTVDYNQDEADQRRLSIPEKSKTFQVSGLSTYVTSVGEVDEELMNAFDAQCRDYITTHLASDAHNYYMSVHNTYAWSDYPLPTFSSVEPAATYVCSRKSIENADKINNFIVRVYKISATDREAPDGVTFYTSVAYTNLLKAPDGKCSLDLQNPAGKLITTKSSLNDVYASAIGPYAENFNISQG